MKFVSENLGASIDQLDLLERLSKDKEMAKENILQILDMMIHFIVNKINVSNCLKEESLSAIGDAGLIHELFFSDV